MRPMPDSIPTITALRCTGTLEKIGQLFMPAAFINDSEEDIQKLERTIREYHIGGLCFFHSRASAATNFEGKEKVVRNEASLQTLKHLISRYQKQATYPLLIAIDAEWGLAMRVENTPQYPYAITLGALQERDDLVFTMARNIARDCQEAGIHWNFAPVADINNNPANPVIGYRSFGENKYIVSNLVRSYAKGLNSIGILNSIKHFPGHGDTGTDSHLGLPHIDKTWKELVDNELFPFINAIAGGIDSVMVGHLDVPAITGGKRDPVSISREAIEGILREKLGFDGVVVSDALNMHAVSRIFSEKGMLEWRAFDAGNDILCFAEHIPEGIAMIAEKATLEEIDKHYDRVLKLKQKAFNSRSVPSDAFEEAGNLNRELATETISFYKGDAKIIATMVREGCTGISIGSSPAGPFRNALYPAVISEWLIASDLTNQEVRRRIKNKNCVLLELIPPKVKPQQNFQLSEEELDLIQWLISEKKVVMYIFGNPYVLRLFDLQKIGAVVIAYQEFGEFQEIAAAHFLGKVTARGVLPVSLHK